MPSIGIQKKNIDDIESVRYVAATLRDISAVALRDLLARFSKNELFYTELEKLYGLVWKIAEQKGEKYAESDVINNNTRIFVAYTTNKHFYGSLNFDVMQIFRKTIGSDDVGMIIGETGQEIWRDSQIKNGRMKYKNFKNDTPDSQEIELFLKEVSIYGRVYIIYPRFLSIYQQKAEMVDVTFRPKETVSKEEENLAIPSFVLEPDLIRVQRFFLTQVRAVLFERILLETELSRIAARLLRMDSADASAQTSLIKERRSLQHEISVFMNARLLENLTGYSQWQLQNN